MRWVEHVLRAEEKGIGREVYEMEVGGCRQWVGPENHGGGV